MIEVVVATLNKSQYLVATLAGLARQVDAPDFDVVVVDDGSTGDLEAELAAVAWQRPAWRRLRVVTHPQTRGRAHARNTGIEACEGEYIVFLDDDSIPSRTLVAAHASAAAGQADAVLGTSRTLETSVPYYPDALRTTLAAHHVPDETVRALQEEAEARGVLDIVDLDRLGLEDSDKALWRLSWQHGKELDRWYAMLDRNVLRHPWQVWITNHAGASRRALLDAGGFDTGFAGWGEEDLDLGYRLHEAGCRFVVVRDPVFKRRHWRNKDDEWRDWIENYRYFVEKHDHAPALLLRWRLVFHQLTHCGYDLELRGLADEDVAQMRTDYERFVGAATAAADELVVWVRDPSALPPELAWTGRGR